MREVSVRSTLPFPRVTTWFPTINVTLYDVSNAESTAPDSEKVPSAPQDTVQEVSGTFGPTTNMLLSLSAQDEASTPPTAAMRASASIFLSARRGAAFT